MKYKIRAVDFDGTLCENKWPEIGAANIKLMEHLRQCQHDGDKIILWTCRTGTYLDEAILFCNYHGLIFDAVNENLQETLEWMGSDSRKIYADVYYDDRACHDFDLPFKIINENTNDAITTFIEDTFGIQLFPYQKAMLKEFYKNKKGEKHT